MALAPIHSTRPGVTPSTGSPAAAPSRHRRARSLAVLLSAAFLAVAIAGPVSAHVGSGTYTVRKTDLTAASGESVGNYLSCPKGKRIISGGAFWHQPGHGPDPQFGVYLRSSTPTTDGKGWYASGLDNAGLQLKLRIVALCLAKAKVGEYTVRTTDLAAASGESVGNYLSCPSGKRIVGGGAFWHRPGEGPDAQLAVLLKSSTPTTDGKGWYASGQNAEGETIQLRIVALCLPKAKVGRYYLRTRDLSAVGVAQVSDHLSCPAGKRIVSGGAFWHRTGEGPVPQLRGILSSSVPSNNGNGWYASGQNAEGEMIQLRLVALCVKRR